MNEPIGWRLLAEIDHSLLALAQALTASEPTRLAEAVKAIENAAEAVRNAQKAKTPDALWAAWRAFDEFRNGAWVAIRDIERKDLTPRLDGPIWKIIDGSEWMTPTLKAWVAAIFAEREAERAKKE